MNDELPPDVEAAFAQAKVYTMTQEAGPCPFVDGNVRTVPTDRKHIESDACWCEPTCIGDYTEKGGRKHFLHRECQ